MSVAQQSYSAYSKQTPISTAYKQKRNSSGLPKSEALSQVDTVQAFTRCAQQEPDNGEAWNNIAAIHLQLQHAPEAFSALSEAVKLKRESWQTWSNYAQAALQTDNNLPAARAVQQVCIRPSCLSMKGMLIVV